MSLLQNRAQNHIISMGYTIINRIKGHVKHMGTDSGKEKNPLWLVRDNNNNESLFMFCEPESIVQLCKDSYSKIEEYEYNNNNGDKITWHKHTNGYILGSGCMLFMHQIIMDCYGNGRGTGNISVDHIDRNPLNNSLVNLRVATREEQQSNSKGVLDGTKRERQCQARSLPEGISQNDLPKYVTYNVNIWDKEQNKSRDFFRIEGHPLLTPKIWESTKSMLVSIQDKLKVTLDTLDKLNNGILPETRKLMPTHVYISTNADGRHHLVYDNRKTKQTKKMMIEDVEFDPNNEEHKHKQLYILNHQIERLFGQSIFTDDFQYIGEPFEVKSKLHLPKNICMVNEHNRTILLFQKKIGDTKLSARINLEKYYESHDESPEINNEIEKKLNELNIIIIHKYGTEHAICEVPDVIPEKAKKELPMYIRIKTASNGDLYIVFDKKNGNDRIATTAKLRQNYDLNNELGKLNEKIIELYGEVHKLDLTGFESKKQIIVPENLYLNTTSKRHYCIKLNTNNTSTFVLPERYDINTELEKVESDSIVDKEYSIEHYKNTYDNWKPDNISIINKDGKSVLLYQRRTKDYKHSITVTLPAENFNINLQLIKMNSKIIEKYGKEFQILQTA
jgi:hypothetical protein